MIISFDYDGTFTQDPEAFREFIALLRLRGHTAIMTTQRCEAFREEILLVTEMPDLPLVFASGRTKEAAARVAGYNVDVWVDDSPYSVHTALTYRGCPETP